MPKVLQRPRRPTRTPEAPPHIIEYFRNISPGLPQVEFCIQCGSCGGSCPTAELMDHTPRQLFALIRAGELDEVLNSNTPWYCASCYFCMVRCPQEIHITDLMYGLKSMAAQSGHAHRNPAMDLSRIFAGFIERYGRAYELGIASRHYLRHPPYNVFGTARMGANLLAKRRLNIKPEKIKGVSQLRKILKRAKELETPL